ncbi:MAG: hypothetical protein ACREEJ_12175, partial [Ensifer adhaerens]
MLLFGPLSAGASVQEATVRRHFGPLFTQSASGCCASPGAIGHSIGAERMAGLRTSIYEVGRVLV